MQCAGPVALLAFGLETGVRFWNIFRGHHSTGKRGLVTPSQLAGLGQQILIF